METRRSTTGMVCIKNGAALVWQTRLQKLVTLSTCEAELVALCETAKEALWLRRILREIEDIPDSGTGREGSALTTFEDNQAAMAIAKSGVQKSRNKHMEIRFFWIHEHIAKK